MTQSNDADNRLTGEFLGVEFVRPEDNFGRKLRPIRDHPLASGFRSGPRSFDKPHETHPLASNWRNQYLGRYSPAPPTSEVGPFGMIDDYEPVRSMVSFDDIGGNDKAKAVLAEIAIQFEEPELYIKWDVPVPKGVLLHGTPGTGKTMMAKAFSQRAKAAFVEVPVSTIRIMWHGESEKKLKRIFDGAERYGGQVVIFFDEIDSLIGNRAGMRNTNDADIHLVNTFLQLMDGMRDVKNIMVLGATNHPERLDDAAIRPGRFDRIVEVELPDQLGCQEIVAKMLLRSERITQRILAEDSLDLSEIGRQLVGLSGADIAEIINRTKRSKAQLERAMRSGAIALGSSTILTDLPRLAPLRISTQDIISVTKQYKSERS